MTIETIQSQTGRKESPEAKETRIVLAGATGQLGRHIAGYLRRQKVPVTGLVRKGKTGSEVRWLEAMGVSVVEVDFNDVAELTRACAGASCVVSALSGLREVIVEAQSQLLEAAVSAGVPRFIPSDFCIDYTRLPRGSNRNLDLRREFCERLEKAPIAATSVLNGMFSDLLTGESPVVLFPLKRVIYWGNADQPMDFTTLDNTAAFTASAALDPSSPRFLRIAGEVASMRDIAGAATEATGSRFHLFRVGGLGLLKTLIRFTRTVFPQKKEVFPAWQGMQYLHNMLTGLPKLHPLDNGRYPDIQWTTIREVLAGRANEPELSRVK
ncbi:NmrA family NAD(P)-binding protein [Larkinella soli]|uniref:NmrA family NAD(P)-binding protein n=1 Tax=Larkinella soli TaxID=1770527 RepID=UPI000FFCB457|nr:NmrA family NAD(P)-binding protein [Larkinella soli]